MKTRITSAIVALPFLLVPLYLGGISMYVMCFIAGVIGFFEFTKAVNKNITGSSIITSLFAIPVYLCMFYRWYSFLPLVFCFLLVVNMIYLVAKHKDENINNIALNFFAFFYTIITFLLLAIIRDYDKGIILVFPIFLTAFASDTFAYFGGRAFGKNKLSPELSPNKTIEGSITGIIVSAILVLLYFMALKDKIGFELINLGDTVLLVVFFLSGAVGAGISQVGDLFASSVKRFTGIKDFGKLIPGHGGIVDRFDSVMMVTPIFFIIYDILYKL